jgi:mycoredoxin
VRSSAKDECNVTGGENCKSAAVTLRSTPRIPRYDREMHVLVYSAPWCRDCREAKRFLEKHQISYTEINIEAEPGAADEVIQHVGKRAIPQFVIDGKWVQPYRPGRGFLHDEMSALFGVAQPR